MTLNGVMAVTLRSFTEFGKPVYQPRRSVHDGIHARVYCIFWCVYDVVVITQRARKRLVNVY